MGPLCFAVWENLPAYALLLDAGLTSGSFHQANHLLVFCWAPGLTPAWEASIFAHQAGYIGILLTNLAPIIY
ncbi:unnamed protein product [Boreogadus saida]